MPPNRVEDLPDDVPRVLGQPATEAPAPLGLYGYIGGKPGFATRADGTFGREALTLAA